MSLKPTVWIDGIPWPDTKTATTPALAGLSMEWALEDDRSMIVRERCTMQLLQRTQDAPPIDLGMMVAVTLNDPYLSVFVGRITDLRAAPDRAYPIDGDPTPPVPAMRYTITAVDLLDELDQIQFWTAPYYVGAESAAAREGRIGGWLRDRLAEQGSQWSWSQYASALDSPNAAQLHNGFSAPALEVLFDTLRGTGRRLRIEVARLVDGTIARRLVGIDDTLRARNVANYLVVGPPGSSWAGMWSFGIVYSGGSIGVIVSSSKVRRADLVWTKRRDDLATDVAITTKGAPANANTPAPDVTRTASSIYSLAALQAARGRSVAQVKTAIDDTAVTTAQLRNVADAYLPPSPETATEPIPWTVRDFPLIDQLDEATARLLLSSDHRAIHHVTMSGVLVNGPAGSVRPRAAVTGINAIWTGRAWQITAQLSRQSQPATGSDWWTCERVASDSRPEIATGTCESVGPYLTFDDFRWIGAM